MNFVYFSGGIFFLVSSIFGLVREKWSGLVVSLAAFCGIAFLIAGISNSVSIALTGSALFAAWMLAIIPERLHKRKK